MKRLAVVGLGYVGLPVAVRAAEAGYRVVGVDSSSVKVEAVRNRESYIEDVSSEKLARLVREGRLDARTTEDDSPFAFDIAVITVPTPVDRLKKPDLTYIVAAGKYVAKYMRGGETVILESTTYPGTTEDVLAPAIESVSGLVAGRDYQLGYSPERINPGDNVNTFQNTPKIVSGVGEDALNIIQVFYDNLVDRTVPVSSPRTAEMAKVFENSWANTAIALTNEFALMCSDMGIDVDEMLDAAATKGHNIVRMQPGLGTGGHCLPVDPLYLRHAMNLYHGKTFKFAELADEINSHMPVHAAGRIREILREQDIPLWKSRILLLGVAYKPGVSDTRESPSLTLLHLLQESGADVTVLDPHVHNRGDAEDAVKMAGEFDVVVVATAHPEFDYEAIRANAKAVFDPRNVYVRGAEKVHKL